MSPALSPARITLLAATILCAIWIGAPGVEATAAVDCSFMCRTATWQSTYCYVVDSSVCHYQKLQYCRDPAPGNATEAQCVTGPVNVPCNYATSTCNIVEKQYPNCGNYRCEIGERWSCPSDCDYYADANKMTEGKDVYTSCPSLDPLQRYYVLTFDDGPTQYTPNLLANLKQANRTGTMFLIGSAMQAYPGYAQDIMAAGHIVGSHTYSHFNMSKQSNESLYQDMALLDYASTLVLGLRPRFLRPPYGSFTTAISDFYNQTDLHMVAWNLDSFDYEWGSDPAVVRDWIQTWVYQNPGHSHYIYLGHDTSLAAVNVIQQSIGQLESYGFAHTTLDKCIYGTKDRALWTSARSVQPKAVQRLVLPLGNNGNVYASAGAATVKHGDRWVAVVTSVVVAAIMIVFG